MTEKIKKILQENKINYSEENGCLSVKPKSEAGFEVSISEDDRFAYVSCLGWHDEFEDKEEAQNCFLNSLTNRVRIIIYTKGNTEYKWEYQANHNQDRESFGTVGLLIFPFWRKSKISIKSNEW